jgi:hypothetical protein
MKQRDGIDHFRVNAKLWNTLGAVFQITNVVFGATAVLLTLTVASKPFHDNSVIYAWLGYMAAVATTLLAFLKAEERGKAWSKAGRYLEDAIGRYDNLQCEYDDVAKARADAVKFIYPRD